MNKSPSNLRSAWLQACVVDSESKPQWLKVKASKVTKQSVQCIIYKELKKKKTLEAKMQIQRRLKRTERESERGIEEEEEDGGAISSLIVSPWVVEVKGLKLQQWL